jgi:hypothetical protein
MECSPSDMLARSITNSAQYTQLQCGETHILHCTAERVSSWKRICCWQQFNEHMAGLRHHNKKMAAAVRVSLGVQTAACICNICRVSCSGPLMLETHLKGAKHQKVQSITLTFSYMTYSLDLPQDSFHHSLYLPLLWMVSYIFCFFCSISGSVLPALVTVQNLSIHPVVQHWWFSCTAAANVK